MNQTLIDEAFEVMKLNDLGTYTVPTHGLYPFQWNWDSCLTALGQLHRDEDRAWTGSADLRHHPAGGGRLCCRQNVRAGEGSRHGLGTRCQAAAEDRQMA